MYLVAVTNTEDRLEGSISHVSLRRCVTEYMQYRANKAFNPAPSPAAIAGASGAPSGRVGAAGSAGSGGALTLTVPTTPSNGKGSASARGGTASLSATARSQAPKSPSTSRRPGSGVAVMSASGVLLSPKGAQAARIAANADAAAEAAARNAAAALAATQPTGSTGLGLTGNAIPAPPVNIDPVLNRLPLPLHRTVTRVLNLVRVFTFF